MSTPITIPFQSTCDIYDQYWEKGYGVRVPESIQWKSYGGIQKFCGHVVTIDCYNDNSRVKEILEQQQSDGNRNNNKVLVVNGNGSMDCALLGDVIASAAVANHWIGIIIYGCVRDSEILKTLSIGIVAVGTTPKKSIRQNQGTWNIPITFGNITIHPTDDYVFVDNDGIVFVKYQDLIN